MTGTRLPGMQAVSELNDMGCAGFADVAEELAFWSPDGARAR